MEGIILSKNLYQDRHIISDVLLRNGKRKSVIFFGGKGGGKRKKASDLEYGFLVKGVSGSWKEESLFSCREWSVGWEHFEIRNHFKAYYLLLFYLEVVRKLALQDEGGGEKDDADYFTLLSNGIYYVEDSLKKGGFFSSEHKQIFLSRLLYYSGVFPYLQECLLCSRNFGDHLGGKLDFDLGGFVCESCCSSEGRDKSVWTGEEIAFLKESCSIRFREYRAVGKVREELLRILYLYFCHQYHLNAKSFRTADFVF